MNLSSQDLAREVAATGFGTEPLEKVARLMSLLGALTSHPFLKPRIALKGGTALNLFHFDVPRLSVDIDLNYIGAIDRDTMMAERPKVEQAIQAVCSREGLTVRRASLEPIADVLADLQERAKAVSQGMVRVSTVPQDQPEPAEAPAVWMQVPAAERVGPRAPSPVSVGLP